jgi:hypothetical protein
MKKVELDIKLTDNYLADLKNFRKIQSNTASKKSLTTTETD